MRRLKAIEPAIGSATAAPGERARFFAKQDNGMP
jgi:hypothetical protein